MPLSPESLMILPHLERLTRRGLWTVGSQPAVDGANSNDDVVGWGPRAGYVFQKGFVEFFCEESEVDKIERQVQQRGNGWVHWFAGNKKVCVHFALSTPLGLKTMLHFRASAEATCLKAVGTR